MTFLQRISGILLFKPATYRAVATNSNLTIESLLIVFSVTALNSILYFGVYGFGIHATSNVLKPVILGWFLFGLIFTWIVNVFFKGQIHIISVLRALGYVRIFQIFGILATILSSFVSFGKILNNGITLIIWLATILCIRESCNVSTKQAIVIFLLSFFWLMILTTPLLYVLGIK
jgi:hypothetical protein